MILTSTAIDGFHRRLEQTLGPTFGPKLNIEEVLGSGTAWKKSAITRTVAFQLSGVSGQTRANRLRGGTAAVFPLDVKGRTDPNAMLDSTAFAGWWEEWISVGHERFTLKTLSWTIFRGTALRRNMDQLFRAEWDVRGAQGASQPHWQFDLLMTVSFPHLRAIDSASGTDTTLLEEVVDRVEDVDLSGIHFGMAGWENAATFPECWQLEPNVAGVSRLVSWAERSVQLAVGELSRLRIIEFTE